MFELQYTPLLIALYAVTAFATLYLLVGFRHYVSSVTRKVRRDTAKAENPDDVNYPSVSVIVYAEDDAENLEEFLPELLEQDYPAPFEVIVVNDGGMESTKGVIARLETKYSNLYMTFTQLGSRSVSRKKLAVTLGIKAARYDVLLHTTGKCRVSSSQWLRDMAADFAKGKDVVIGYAAPVNVGERSESRKRLHAFDRVRESIETLSWAIAGRPYRGTACNLAYRRDTFFKNKGFSRSLNLKYGDDDVFLSEIANGDNTSVQLAKTSMVELLTAYPSEWHRENKLRYDHTYKSLRTHVRLFFGSCSLFWWVQTAAAAALAVIGLPSLIPAIAAGVMLLATWITLMVTWRNASRALNSRPIMLTFVWFMFVHPFYTLYYKVKGRRTRAKNFAWN